MTATPINVSYQTENRVIEPCSNSLDGADNAISACGVEMVYQTGGDRYHALRHVDLTVRYGDIQLLMGPSGSGKTTLLSILAGILTPTAGSVRLLGQEITKLSSSKLAQFRLENIGFIFQGFNLFPALSAIENIEVALNLKGIRGSAARQQAMQLLDQVGLADRAKLHPQDLSGGQKQRVAIARALAGNPTLIMADEPTAALDSHNGHAVIELLRTLAKERGRTVLIVTHDPRIADVADHIAYLEDGILTNGERSEISRMRESLIANNLS
ncbi:putative ABC transporter ATP-binding protein [Leptolyngbya boryana NIES-2135]|jgi:putative ABC transport system ATP-binding protein|uniref:Putative ABC transporter ATP-binding protein n=1 Tax=Leptolyngbya boryana NIES-2135 TaxID=1973484 RepID=A0A1Z4JM41_LEPBY|nr:MULTISPECIES: ABC transporter ATP-binding protein [Leptolyngbya]BAY57812.1 putative ABC transporter ATP-binding protein [Leptolyngbya boryana NIES-2135]MBD2367257.1 ABC transporter ATP-binding protein [Leptolyngbya sp. FACHB-161]MBD2373782.1 ABC transporter ATP-binding protein [Leptolyngbya sp. FACHB-238]MBD2398419.1 ABC transporter ATP-binding protein [Leptolyngbya sp. FACHB-239]MBD2404084.1 ABC transporter ATP-binding protein [Leptolyngbya sp. FACHB-402]